MSKIKVNEIEAATGTTVTIPTGQTFTVTDGISATNLSGTIADARLPTVPVTKGGTGLTSLGSAGQVVQVNSGGNALEFAAASSGKIGAVTNITATAQQSLGGNGRAMSNYQTLSSPFNSFSITREANTSKVLMNMVLTTGGNSDAWLTFRIQYSVDNSSWTDLPDIAYDAGSNIPQSHFGHGLHGSSSVSNNSTTQASFTYLHNSSSISQTQIYYRLQWLYGHGSSNYAVYLNRSHDMSDAQRMSAPSNVILMEVKA